MSHINDPPPPPPPVLYSMLSRKHVDITHIFEHDKGERSRGLLGVRRRGRERGVCPDQFGPDYTHNKHEAILVKTFMFKMYPEKGRYEKKKKKHLHLNLELIVSLTL